MKIKRSQKTLSKLDDTNTFVIIHLGKAGQVFEIDGVAAEVWGLLKSPRRVSQLEKFLLKKGFSNKEAKKNLKKLISELKRLGFIEVEAKIEK